MSDDKNQSSSNTQTKGVDVLEAIGQEEGVASRSDREQQAVIDELSRKPTASGLNMHVRVYSPFTDYYDGAAFSLSAENATGPFDILPKHHNFLSLLSPCELVIRTVDEGEKRIRISGGLMHVKADEIIVFLDV